MEELDSDSQCLLTAYRSVPKGLFTLSAKPLKVQGKIKPVSRVPKDYLWHTWGEAAYIGKFIRRRRSWKRLFRRVLLGVLGADQLGAGPAAE